MKTWLWILAPLFLALQYEIWFAPGGITSIWRMHRQITHETVINQRWAVRNQALIVEIQDLKNGNQAIEDHARADLGMIKPGEVLYQLP